MPGEFELEEGDVAWKIAANGSSSFLIAWPGEVSERTHDLSTVFTGGSEPETLANIDAFMRGDRSLVIKELSDSIAFWRETLSEYDRKAETSEDWRREAQDCRTDVEKLEAMLRWAQQTSRTFARARNPTAHSE